MTIREALRAKQYKLRKSHWNPTQYLEIRPAIMASLFGNLAWLWDHGASMPYDVNLDTDADWLVYEEKRG
jgi:hypothetical protein